MSRTTGKSGSEVSLTVLKLEFAENSSDSGRSCLRQPILAPPLQYDRRHREKSDAKLSRLDCTERWQNDRGFPQPANSLGLSGTRYILNDSTNANNSSSKTGNNEDISAITRLVNSRGNSSVDDCGRMQKASERERKPGKSQTDSKISLLSLPPLAAPCSEMLRSENTFSSNRVRSQTGGSLFINQFGFCTLRPDSVTGNQPYRQLRLHSGDMSDGLFSDLLQELQQQVQKQLLACQSMAYIHRGSRAAASLLGLRHTVSPAAVPTSSSSSFITRHVPSQQPGTPSDSPKGMGGKAKRRAKHLPGTVGKLNTTRQLLPDNKGHIFRPDNLPAVSGNSLRLG